jgi:hypothetical protein
MDKIEFLRQRVEEEKKKNSSKLEEEKLEKEYNELKSKNKLLEKKKSVLYSFQKGASRIISRINQGKKKSVPVRIVYKYKPRRRTNFRNNKVMYRPTIRKPMIRKNNDNLFNQLMRL